MVQTKVPQIRLSGFNFIVRFAAGRLEVSSFAQALNSYALLWENIPK